MRFVELNRIHISGSEKTVSVNAERIRYFYPDSKKGTYITFWDDPDEERGVSSIGIRVRESYPDVCKKLNPWWLRLLHFIKYAR